MRHHLRTALLLIVVVFTCGFLGLLFGQRLNVESSLDNQVIRNSLAHFTRVYEIVEQNYAEPVDADKDVYKGAIPGMLRVLDPHSTFFDPKAYSLLKEEETGKYYGVGMTIAERAGKVIVVAPFVGSPAYKAGIHPGDIIVAINGKPAANLSVDEVADLVRGPGGTSVRISVLRENSSKPVDFTVTRGEIPRDAIDVAFMVRPGIGYLHIASFNETATSELRKYLEQFGNLKGLVLDLRQDPGGLLNAAVGVAGDFLPQGTVIVSQRGRASTDVVYRATRGDGSKDYPIVVLVDRGTASAAEIVAGALQDHDRALVAGETTFGKGLVQTVFPLSYNTALALTTAKYYTPSGRLIQRNYTGISLYDYYYGRNEKNGARPRKQEIKYTDSGRPVYGGDGITPDVKLAQPKPNHFQDVVAQHYAIFNFAQDYVARHQVSHNFTVNDDVLKAFREYLNQKKIAYTGPEFTRNLDWLRTQIMSAVFTDSFGLQQGLAVQAARDPQVVEALQLLPKAEQLVRTSRQKPHDSQLSNRASSPGNTE